MNFPPRVLHFSAIHSQNDSGDLRGVAGGLACADVPTTYLYVFFFGRSHKGCAYVSVCVCVYVR